MSEKAGWTGKKCPACRGTGEKDSDVAMCPACAGTGDEHISPVAPETSAKAPREARRFSINRTMDGCLHVEPIGDRGLEVHECIEVVETPAAAPVDAAELERLRKIEAIVKNPLFQRFMAEAGAALSPTTPPGEKAREA
jgi:RecJ-like exonuclease